MEKALWGSSHGGACPLSLQPVPVNCDMQPARDQRNGYESIGNGATTLYRWQAANLH